MTMQRKQVVYICSDATGETAEAVTKATARQFGDGKVNIVRYGQIKHEDDIRRIADEAAEAGGFIAYTLVQPELRETMKMEGVRAGVRTVDILGPMMQAFVDTFHDSPHRQPGLMYQIDDEYYRRIEAIEFAIRCDDGKYVKGYEEADVVLLGVSRTSKTPLSMVLAHKGLRVANFPIAPEAKPPEELFRIPSDRIVGLMMDASILQRVRSEHLKWLGLPEGAQYAQLNRIQEELDYAQQLMNKLECRVIDVTGKAIEETAGMIMNRD
ncbi:kinase/pyrophosphorylase [Paenibacillus sp. SC116]|uniref:pyruvate, water dikinase regulatory protein n=1 Tax=Paenibacillus sp. SC116 TaxID=2968986 RepID=UPI00215B0A56|nr:pyruvate, water dikinase regulatory protein [Paenibacillus sp. SC116]MCR8844507.1 kinase/pyrophosphorylase [Paenibacillus sp. SC116]